jgi:hypothetical protein
VFIEIIWLLISCAVFVTLLTLANNIGRKANADKERLKGNEKGQRVVRFIEDIYSCRDLKQHIDVSTRYIKGGK